MLALFRRPHSQCLTWTCCMKSQSCVHKFNIFFPIYRNTMAYLTDGNVCILIQTISFLRPSNSPGVFDLKSWIFDLNNNFIAPQPLCSAQKWMPAPCVRGAGSLSDSCLWKRKRFFFFFFFFKKNLLVKGIVGMQPKLDPVSDHSCDSGLVTVFLKNNSPCSEETNAAEKPKKATGGRVKQKPETKKNEERWCILNQLLSLMPKWRDRLKVSKHLELPRRRHWKQHRSLHHAKVSPPTNVDWTSLGCSEFKTMMAYRQEESGVLPKPQRAPHLTVLEFI